MNRKERRRTAALKQVEENAVRVDVTQESVGTQSEYENAIAQAHELGAFNTYGMAGPDLDDSDGFDRHELPEPVDTEEEN